MAGNFAFACDMLYTQFGNLEPIERCYPYIRKWMLHLHKEYLKDGLITKDRYGDWCVPPESLELIHSKDSARITDGTLISTAYYIKLLDMMSRFASLQNLEEDRNQWQAWAKEMKDAFNKNICTSNAGLHKNPVTHSIRIASATVIILSQPICCLWHSISYQKIARKMLQAKS